MIGWDPVKYQDRSALIVLEVTQLLYSVARIETLEGRDYTTHARRVAELADWYKAHVLMDSTGVGDPVYDLLKRAGVSVQGYKFTNQSKQELIDRLTMAFEQGELLIPQHRDLITELQFYEYTLTASGSVRLGTPERTGAHDDLVTALALQAAQGRKHYSYADYLEMQMNRTHHALRHPSAEQKPVAISRAELLTQQAVHRAGLSNVFPISCISPPLGVYLVSYDSLY